jgi:preprotein translocase subunit SecE
LALALEFVALRDILEIPFNQTQLLHFGGSIVAKKEASKTEKNDNQEAAKEVNAFGFVQETQEELAKVVWPSRQQLLSESAAVILMVSLVATVIYLVDNFFAWGAGKVFG